MPKQLKQMPAQGLLQPTPLGELLGTHLPPVQVSLALQSLSAVHCGGLGTHLPPEQVSLALQSPSEVHWGGAGTQLPPSQRCPSGQWVSS